MVPTSLSTGPQCFTPLPTIQLGPSGAGSGVGGLVHALDPCGSLQGPLLRGWESLQLPPQPPQAFLIRGLRLYFPKLYPWVAWSASLPAFCLVYLFTNGGPPGGCYPFALPDPFSATLSLALSVYLCANVGPQGLLVVRLPAPFFPYSTSLGPSMATGVFSAPVPISTPPTGLDECLFFISLVLDFLPFDFLSVLVVQGGAVCLPTLPSWFSPVVH